MSSVRAHWPEYVCEAVCLGLFMVSAACFATAFQHPVSPVSLAMAPALVGRVPMGLAMGATAMAIVYSPIGRRSGAHMNPAITLTFLRLGKMAKADAAFYIAAQFAGGLAGILVATALLARLPAHPSVNYVATLPGPAGPVVALLAEAIISFGMMSMILGLTNHPRFNRYTGFCAGLLVCTYIVIEAPLSGMSMNAARSLGPALLAGSLDSMWIYGAAPLVGMLAASELYLSRHGAARVRCAKLHHPATGPCIFHCQFGDLAAPVHAAGLPVREVSA